MPLDGLLPPGERSSREGVLVGKLVSNHERCLVPARSRSLLPVPHPGVLSRCIFVSTNCAFLAGTGSEGSCRLASSRAGAGPVTTLETWPPLDPSSIRARARRDRCEGCLIHALQSQYLLLRREEGARDTCSAPVSSSKFRKFTARALSKPPPARRRFFRGRLRS